MSRRRRRLRSHQVGEAWEEFVQEQVYPEPGTKAKDDYRNYDNPAPRHGPPVLRREPPKADVRLRPSEASRVPPTQSPPDGRLRSVRLPQHARRRLRSRHRSRPTPAPAANVGSDPRRRSRGLVRADRVCSTTSAKSSASMANRNGASSETPSRSAASSASGSFTPNTSIRTPTRAIRGTTPSWASTAKGAGCATC